MLEQILNELKNNISDEIVKKYKKQELSLPFIGVKISTIKNMITKYKINRNNDLAYELFNTKNYDAMILAKWIINAKDLDNQVLEIWSNLLESYEVMTNILCPIIADSNFSLKFVDEFLNDNSPLGIKKICSI